MAKKGRSNMLARTVVKGLKGLNISLAQLADKLWLLAKMAKVTFCGIWIFFEFLAFKP